MCLIETESPFSHTSGSCPRSLRELGVSHLGGCAQRWGVRKAHPLADRGLQTEGRFLTCGA